MKLLNLLPLQNIVNDMAIANWIVLSPSLSLSFSLSLFLSLCGIICHVHREGARVTWGYINRILGQPSLIRESSIARFPFSGVLSFARNSASKYSTTAGTAVPSKSKGGFKNIVLHPSLQRRIEHLARATANTKTHQAPFRNMMFYGPPGTGKTMVAREIARKSVCHFKSSILFLFSFYSFLIWSADCRFLHLFVSREQKQNFRRVFFFFFFSFFCLFNPWIFPCRV